jgi:hypothetical protein
MLEIQFCKLDLKPKEIKYNLVFWETDCCLFSETVN